VPRACPLVLDDRLPWPDAPSGVAARRDDRPPQGGATAAPDLDRLPGVEAARHGVAAERLVMAERLVVAERGVTVEPAESLEPVELGNWSLRTVVPWLFPGARRRVPDGEVPGETARGVKGRMLLDDCACCTGERMEERDVEPPMDGGEVLLVVGAE
jgi:hypothetical protein